MRLGVIVLLLLSVPLFAADPVAEEEPPALTKAREKYQKDILPITKAYLATLEGLKKQLGAKGDLKAAQAVQNEIDVMSMDAKPGRDWLDGTEWEQVEGRKDTRKFENGKVYARDPWGSGWDDTYQVTGRGKAISKERGEPYTIQGSGALLVRGTLFKKKR